MRSFRWVATVCLLGAASCASDTPDSSLANEQAAPAVALGEADGEFALQGSVEAVVEAGDHIWWAIYQLPGLGRYNFATGVTDTIGASGNLPGQFRLPSALFPSPGGGIYALDGVTRRLVQFGSDGSSGSVTNIPAVLDPFFLRRDAEGQWYSALADLSIQDSVPIMTLNPGSERADSVTRLHVPKATVSIPLAGGGRYVAPPEFSSRDLWDVLPNGTVWVARGGPHRVDYRMPDGTWTVGGPRPYTPIASTDADRGTMRGLPAPEGFPAQALQYAPTKGPFLEARAAADGEVWTWLTQPAPATEERYAVFMPGVAETWVVSLPKGHRVVGIGAEWVYVANRESEGSWRVARHPRPTHSPL